MSVSDTRLERVTTDLNNLIGEFAAQGADKLLPERELAVRLGVSRSVLRRALATAETEGRIFRVLGRAGGAFISQTAESAPIPSVLFDVASRKVERDLNHVKGVPQMLTEQGFTVSTKVVSEHIEPAPARIAELLGLVEGDNVISLLRLRYADDEPLSLERMYLDPDRFPGLLDHSPIRSLYDLIERHYGTTIASSDETIDCISSERQVSVLLGVKPGTPLLALRRVSYDADDTPIEASVDLFRTDRTRLRVHAVVTRPTRASA